MNPIRLWIACVLFTTAASGVVDGDSTQAKPATLPANKVVKLCDNKTSVEVPNNAKHHAKTYRMGYEAKSYNEIAALMTSIIGQPCRYEPRPPEEWFDAILAAGAEPAYMKGVYERYRDFGLGKLIGDGVFDNLPSIIGRKPNTLAKLIQDNADKFRY